MGTLLALVVATGEFDDDGVDCVGVDSFASIVSLASALLLELCCGCSMPSDDDVVLLTFDDDDDDEVVVVAPLTPPVVDIDDAAANDEGSLST